MVGGSEDRPSVVKGVFGHESGIQVMGYNCLDPQPVQGAGTY